MSDQAAPPVVLQVQGMTCQGCVNAVTRLIQKADPAATVAIDLASGRVAATTVQAADDLAARVTKAGYPASVSV